MKNVEKKKFEYKHQTIASNGKCSSLKQTGFTRSRKVMEFENSFSRPGKVMEFGENGHGHGKVMEFLIFSMSFGFW